MKFWQFWENLVGIISTVILSHSLSLLQMCWPALFTHANITRALHWGVCWLKTSGMCNTLL